MGVHLERDVIIPPGAGADFWRSPTTAGTGPDGVNDVTEDIARTGNTGIGSFLAAPVAKLDVAAVARSGVDGRVAGVTPLYVTGNIPGFGGIVVPPATLTGGVEFRHSNQTQGIGFAYNGIYMTGSNVDNDFTFLNRGTGQISFVQQALNPAGGGINYINYTGVALAANQGWQHRWWANGALEKVQIIRRSTVGAGLGVEEFWQAKDAAGVFRNAMIMYPSVTNPSSFSLQIDLDVINDAKLVLFGHKTTAFFGMGIKASTLAYFINVAGSHHRWYQGSPGTQLMGLSGVGNLTLDPNGTGAGISASPLLRFGSETSTEQIASNRVTAGRFLNDIEIGTANTRRFAVLNNGRIYMQNVPIFANDAAAAVGGLLTGELWRDPLGIIHYKF
jgi:hypothetical protein